MTDITHDDEIRDYLVGRLSERERLRFQDRVARDPALARELEETRRLRAGLRGLKEEGYFATWGDGRQRNRTLRLARWLPLAAAAVVAAVCVGAWWQVRTPDSVLSASLAAGSRPSAQWSFMSTRGDGVPRLTLPADGLIEFRVAPEISGAQTYRISLLSVHGSAARSIGVLKGRAQEADSYLHAYADAARLTPGDYRLRIDAQANGAIRQVEFPFKLVANDRPTSP